MAMPYFPATYGYPMPYQSQMYQNQMPQQPSIGQNCIIAAWVQGEPAMKSFALGPNQKAFLFNTEENTFCMKSTDASGMPLPIEMFEYKRRDGTSSTAQPTQIQQPQIDVSAFVTRDELESRIAKFMSDLEAKSQNRQPNNQNRGDQKHGK